MCVNYVTVSRQLAFEYFRTPKEVGEGWREELYQDYVGPIIVHDEVGNRKGLVGSYGFIPKRRMPPGQRLTTMNARAETVGQLRSYKSAWAKSQLCLVPMRHFFEPNWEQEKHVRWSIGMASGEPFAVAGLYRDSDEEDGKKSFSFTQLTINADELPQPLPSPRRRKAFTCHRPSFGLRRVAWMQRPRARQDVPSTLSGRIDDGRTGAEGGAGQADRAALKSH